MAIQKLPVHGADITSTILSLLVPTYFDSYEESETTGTYNLYKGTDIIATVNSYGNVVLKYNSGASTIQTIPTNHTLRYLYVCNNGLAFETYYSGDPAQRFAIASFLTKDNNGETVIVYMGISSSSTSTYVKAQAANYRSIALSESTQYAINMAASQVTSLAPIVLTDDHTSYCPNAYIAVYRQNNGVSEILDIAGTKFISNGGMLLRD